MRFYCEFLQGLDEWSAAIQADYSEKIQCGKGCALCCSGLFDINMPDAVLVARGFASLQPAMRRRVLSRARPIQESILRRENGLSPPYLLGALGEARIDAIVDGIPSPACPFLTTSNECMIYSYRPLACRLEGLPMVDSRDGLFGDWCELNFTEGVSSQEAKRLTRDYGGIQQSIGAHSRTLEEVIPCEAIEDEKVFIPSVIVEFERFWQPLLVRIK